MKMDYDECRAKISIIDIAEEFGYTRISGSRLSNELDLCSWHPQKSRRRNSHLS